MRTFVLSRLSKPVLTGRRFTLLNKFDLNEYLSGSLGLFKGQDDFEVVVELDAFAADDVRGRRLHSSQELTEVPGGMLRVRPRLDSLEEAERWVLSLGTHATVIRPEPWPPGARVPGAAKGAFILFSPDPADRITVSFHAVHG